MDGNSGGIDWSDPFFGGEPPPMAGGPDAALLSAMPLPLQGIPFMPRVVGAALPDGRLPFPGLPPPLLLGNAPGTRPMRPPGAPRGPPTGPTPSVGPGQGKSVYYKTRMCVKWQKGQCAAGDSCKYAHGEADLRAPVQEGPGGRDKAAQQQGWQEAAARGPTPEGTSAAELQEKYRKTKLCMKFANTGACPYGDNCIFAHGPEELSSGGGAGQHGGSGLSGPPVMLPRPGGPLPVQLPPQMPLPLPLLPGAVPGSLPRPPQGAHGMLGLGAPGPRPPPGLPPPAPPPQGLPYPLRPAVPPSGPAPAAPPARPEVPALPPVDTSQVTYLESVQALCAVLGMGKLQYKDTPLEAKVAAMQAVSVGTAFKDNAYADGMEAFIRA